MDYNSDMITESPPLPPPPPSPQQLIELIQSLETATRMAKQLPTTSDATHHRLIYSSLTSAHLSLSSFLSAAATDDGGGQGGDESMMLADGDISGGASGGEEVERVEERMRELFYVPNKRLKRQLSATAAAVAERVGFNERDCVRKFDPIKDRLRNLDLVYQFHAIQGSYNWLYQQPGVYIE